jgi:iron complex transport system permease protein
VENTAQWNVLFYLRLPRLLAIVLVGFGLSVAGAVMQGLLRNPLADPGLLGLSSGASLAVLIFWLGVSSLMGFYIWQWLMPFIAMLGSFAVLSFLYLSSACSKQHSISSFVLLGIACNAIFSACIALLLYLSPDSFMQAAILWSFGGVTTVSWLLLCSACIVMLVGLGLLLHQSMELNVLALGEEDALALGVSLSYAKLNCIIGVALVVASAVSLAGPISFVGLMVPHIMRRIYGPDHRQLLICSGLGGAILLLLADMASRSLSRSEILPLGIITALIGAVFFLWLLFYYRMHQDV